MAIWAPCHEESPSAMTSSRRPSTALRSARSEHLWTPVHQPLCTLGLPRIPTGILSFPRPLPWYTLHDGGQTYQVGGHGRCAWKGEDGKAERPPCDSRRRESSEKCRCKRSVLGPEQISAGVVQSWPHHLIDELLLHLPGRLLFGWRRIRQFNPRRHLETSGSQRPWALTYCLETRHQAVCQTCDNELSDEWVALSDHAEGIGPTGPMCGNPDTDSTGKTKTPC